MNNDRKSKDSLPSKRRPPVKIRKEIQKSTDRTSFKKRQKVSQGVQSKDATEHKAFPIVGVGASAGGLEAFMQLLAKMPVDTGMAFILVQHLDPTHPSMSVDIIARSTRLKVQEIEDGMSVRLNNVYVIPPNHNMRIVDGILNLLPRTSAPGQNMTIDFFFQSLAQSQKSRAIGIVLSGTGSDGTQGLEAIKAEGGVTYAQDPKTAKFEGMPQHAIAAGVADLVLRPEDIADELAELANHPYLAIQEEPRDDEALAPDSRSETKESSRHDEGLRKIFSLLRAHTKVDFSNYKYATINRRIQRRMMVQKSKNLEEYATYLHVHPEEIRALYNDILINVSEFFRDPDSFKALTTHVFPQLIKDRAAQAPIRIWVPGCATGEEVYSVAISLIEFLENTATKAPFQIFATDISDLSIQKARLAQYPESIAKNVSKERLQNFFDKLSGGYKVRKAVRDLCLFSKHDMTCDPPFAKLDLVSCRNVLIYFGPALQTRVIPIFHYALKPNGFLWLGKSETPGGTLKLFTVVDKTHKIYSKANVQATMNFPFPTGAQASEKPIPIKEEPLFKKRGGDFQNDTDKILSKFAPPSVLINADMEILQFRGRIVPFLEPAVSNNLFQVARPELVAGLRMLIQSVKKENKSVKKEGLHFQADGKHITFSVELLPTNPLAPPKERTFLILFKEVDGSARMVSGKQHKAGKKSSIKDQDLKDQQINELVQELSDTKDSQQSLVEQYETTQEELTAANEELQSANEELQSTNEELETAKEELQSTNEELVTVNDELQIRNVDLTTLGSDLNNLLASTEIPILMVGNDKRVRRFTPKAETAFNLISTDIGRPVGDIRSNFGVDLETLISEVTEDLRPKEVEVQDRKGAWRRLQIRPYKTIDNKIDGAIIALVDIDLLKQKEKSSREAFEYVTSIVEAVPLALVVLEGQLQLKSANPAFFQFFQVTDEHLGEDIFSVLETRGNSLESLNDIFTQTIATGAPFRDLEVDCEFLRIGRRTLILSGRKIHWKGDEPDAILLSFVDITERRRLEDERKLLLVKEQEARSEAERANRAKDVFLATLSHELRTPLSAILTWAQLIRTGKVDSEKAKQGISVIEKSAKTQSQLIDDLLDISRIIAGKLAMEIKEVDPVVAIRAAIEAVRTQAEKKAIQIEATLSSETGKILGDPVRLQQIVWNLLNNAIKFSPKDGSIGVRLEFVDNQTERFAEIKVRDRGKGIPPEFLPHIFNRFSQADSASTRVHGGLGLGLSIVRSLVELQGGTVSAENVTDGKGAIFTVTFPLISSQGAIIQTESISDEELRQHKNEGEDQPKLDGLRILFVDDDENTREAISIYLKSFGAEVMSVGSASETLKSLSTFKPNILVSDITMPGEDGYTLIRKIRELNPELGGKVPAVALTASATGEDAKRAFEAGFQAHIAKPVEANALAKVILKFAGCQKK